MTPTGDLACNPGICPDWESNQQPFGSQPALNPLNYASRGYIAYYFLIHANTRRGPPMSHGGARDQMGES